ncbi:restriction endonuclease subunit S [Acetobacterium carbinolicum]|uniref:restriction endonuclease subunit S n=1 Tax=Acetobacterium carbinolicum TaxID=52690 RepID=UPI0039C905F8
MSFRESYELTIGEFTTWKSGGTPLKSKSEYWNGNIPWISAKNFKETKISRSDMMITEEGLKKGSRIANVGSILLLVRGSGLFNDIPIGLVVKPVAFNQDLKSIEVDQSKITPEYFHFWLRSNKHVLEGLLEHTSIGAGKFDIDRLQSLKVVIPQKCEQISIVDTLKLFDDKIELNNHINKNLEEMAQALYKSWFVDFEPFQDGEFEDSELGMIPKGWRAVSLNDVCASISVKHNFNNEKLIFLNTGDIEKGLFLHCDYSDVNQMPGQAKKSIAKGDILYSEIRPINKHYAYVNFDSDDYVVSTKLMVIRATAINNRRLYHYLTSNDIIHKLQNEAESRSGTFPQIRFEHIRKLMILIADIETENTFVNFLEDLYNKIDNNNYQSEVLKELRNALLPKLMSGEIRVPIEEVN